MLPTTSAVTTTTKPPVHPDEVAALAAARERGASAGIGHYRYSVTTYCLCPTLSAVVEVRDGRVELVSPLSGTQPDAAREALGLTIEQRFAEIEALFAADDPGEISAAYNVALGYPAILVADPIRLAIDDEYTTEIGEFEVLGQP